MPRRDGTLADTDYSELPPLAGHQNLAETVYQHLLSAIYNLQIKPGEELNEVRLARRLGVSVTPVREALLRLSGDGLVVREPQHRPRVVLLTLKEIEELYDVRGALESFAAAEATKHVTAQDLRRLDEIQERGRRFAVEGKVEGYDAYHEEIHQTILHLAGNDLLMRMMQPLRVKVRLCRYHTSMLPDRRFHGLTEHEEIISLLRARDASAVAAAMRRHCEGGKQSYLEHYAKRGDSETSIGRPKRRNGRPSVEVPAIDS